jgi:hypothetical protein
MHDIGDIMDVNIEDLSPEQQQQLKDVADQFQQKCLLSFKKNRSGEASQYSLPRRALEARQSSLLHKVLEVSQFDPLCRPQEGNQSSHLRRAA